MKEIIAKAVALSVLLLLSFGSLATSISIVSPCTYEPIKTSVESSQYSSLMHCKEWKSDGKSQEIVSYKLTAPAFTPLKNCTVTEESLKDLSRKTLLAPPVAGKCLPHSSGLYISMVYVADKLNYDPLFSQLRSLISDLEKGKPFAKNRIDIPFYKFWFCDECDEFLDDINKSNSILIRSINMNYSDENLANLAIKVDSNRWLLSLYRIDNEFFIKQLDRTR